MYLSKKELDEELMSEIAKFAGTYKATDAANAAYGEGEALLDLIVLDDGRLRDGGIASRQPILYPNHRCSLRKGTMVLIYVSLQIRPTMFNVNIIFIHKAL